jgi:hypothetical protein
VGRSAWSVALAARAIVAMRNTWTSPVEHHHQLQQRAHVLLCLSSSQRRRKGATAAVLPSATREWGAAACPVQGDGRVLLVRLPSG